MTVPEALGLIREVGGVKIRGGNLRVKFPEKDRARLQPALYTLRRCKGEALATVAEAVCPEITAFKNILGGRLTLLPPGTPFKPTSEEKWRKDAADKVFAEHRKLQARYAGMSLEQKEELARQAERRQKALRRAWASEQREIQAGYAKWCRLREVAPDVADRHRREHADKSGDKAWMIEFASLKSVEGVRIPGRRGGGRQTRKGKGQV
jgi:hypothetical protein